VTDDAVLNQLTDLGLRYDGIRALVLTSTRASGGTACDVLSDYDLLVYAREPAWFLTNDDWYQSLGASLVMLRYDSDEEDCHTRLVQYADGTRVDYGIRHVDELTRAGRAGSLPAGLDLGYKVLLDKDACATALPPPTFREHVLAAPTAAEYASVVDEFWWDVIYVPKHLWRGEMVGAQYSLSCLRHDMVRRVLEWCVGMEKGWSWNPGVYGKHLDGALDAETRQELAGTYPRGDIAEIWQALFGTVVLFRKTALRAGAGLGYAYPHDLDARVTVYLRTIRNLDRRAATRADLARLLADGLCGQGDRQAGPGHPRAGGGEGHGPAG